MNDKELLTAYNELILKHDLMIGAYSHITGMPVDIISEVLTQDIARIELLKGKHVALDISFTMQ